MSGPLSSVRGPGTAAWAQRHRPLALSVIDGDVQDNGASDVRPAANSAGPTHAQRRGGLLRRRSSAGVDQCAQFDYGWGGELCDVRDQRGRQVSSDGAMTRVSSAALKY